MRTRSQFLRIQSDNGTNFEGYYRGLFVKVRTKIDFTGLCEVVVTIISSRVAPIHWQLTSVASRRAGAGRAQVISGRVMDGDPGLSR